MSLREEATELLQQSVNLSKEDRFDEAANLANEITSLRGVMTQSLIQKGRCSWEMKRWTSAMEDFLLAEKIEPDNHDIKWALALMQFQRGMFVEGGPRSKHRWKAKSFDSARLKTNKPMWTKDGGYKNVLVWSEQGVGDQILYSNLLEEVRKITPNLMVMIDARLMQLFKRSMPWATFVPQNQRIQSHEIDSQIPMGNLVSQFIACEHDIQKLWIEESQYTYKSLLIPDKDKKNTFRAAFNLRPNEKLVGISWRSGAPKVGDHKSCSLVDLLPILKMPGYRFVSLQYGNWFEEIFNFEKDHGIRIETVPEIDNTVDFDGLASLIDDCDCILTVSNVTAHLAGAIGAPTFLLDSNKLWYWGNVIGNKSLWYPAVKTYPKWYATSSWDAPIRDAKMAIEDWSSTNSLHTFVFYRTAKTRGQLDNTTIFVRSLRDSNPHASIIWCTDFDTPLIEENGLMIVRFEYQGSEDDHMANRLEAFSRLGLDEVAMYLDDDMIVNSEIYPDKILNAEAKAAFCGRFFGKNMEFNPYIRGLDFSEYAGKKSGDVFPFHACASITRDSKPWEEMLDILYRIDPKYRKWYGDIECMKIYSKLYECQTLSEEEYGCLPEEIDSRSPKIIHFKGNRKQFMAGWKK